MDDRKKRIDDLVKNNQEAASALNTLLENFGEKLYSQADDSRAEFDDIARYKACLREIAESNATIGKIEEKNRRLRELEESIEAKEREEKEREKEIAVIYRRLGKTLLENPSYADYASLFREQADALTAKLESLENRIGELENKERSNVFSWIGKSAQSLVLRSFLSKAKESQEQLYFSAGERFNGHDSISGNDEAAAILAEVAKFKNASRASEDALAILKDEKRIILASFGIDGNPQKQIQGVKNHITLVKDELRALYRRFGAQAAGIDEDITPERKYFIDAMVSEEDGEIIGRAVRINQSIADNDKAILKLKASLAIDEEKSRIEKHKRSIEEKKTRIGDLQKDIENNEAAVRDCEKNIQELEKQL